MLDRPPEPPNRWKRYRARLRNGKIVPAMDGIGADELQFLIDLQWLAEADAADRHAIGLAINRMLAASARRR